MNASGSDTLSKCLAVAQAMAAKISIVADIRPHHRGVELVIGRHSIDLSRDWKDESRIVCGLIPGASYGGGGSYRHVWVGGGKERLTAPDAATGSAARDAEALAADFMRRVYLPAQAFLAALNEEYARDKQRAEARAARIVATCAALGVEPSITQNARGAQASAMRDGKLWAPMPWDYAQECSYGNAQGVSLEYLGDAAGIFKVAGIDAKRAAEFAKELSALAARFHAE